MCVREEEEVKEEEVSVSNGRDWNVHLGWEMIIFRHEGRRGTLNNGRVLDVVGLSPSWD